MSGGIRRDDALAPDNLCARRKIRTGHNLHQIFDGYILEPTPVVNHIDDCVAQLGQVVRWDAGSHAHGDAGGTHQQHIGECGGQHGWLLGATIVVVPPIDRVFLQISQKLFAIARETCLGVTHGRGRVAIDRTEVALAIDQQIAH